MGDSGYEYVLFSGPPNHNWIREGNVTPHIRPNTSLIIIIQFGRIDDESGPTMVIDSSNFIPNRIQTMKDRIHE